jgi:hypothetical protein
MVGESGIRINFISTLEDSFILNLNNFQQRHCLCCQHSDRQLVFQFDGLESGLEVFGNLASFGPEHAGVAAFTS